jgi:hypothetical protein
MTGTLTAPKLELLRGTTVLETNTGWTTAVNAAAISTAAANSGAFAFAAGSADSAILTTLAPGGYTAFIGSGVGAAGVGLIGGPHHDTGPVDLFDDTVTLGDHDGAQAWMRAAEQSSLRK